MKKLALAAAISAAAVPTVSMAETTIYGNFRYTVGTVDTGGTDTGITAVNNASRLGVKGSVGDKDGITGFYHLQMGANPDGNGATGTGGGPTALTDRFYFAGFKGSFGTALFGRASSPYKMAGLKLDPFYDTAAGSHNAGSNYGFSSFTNGFFNNVVAYITPKIAGGLTANIVAVIDDSANDKHAFNIGGAWSSNGVTVGLQYIDADDLLGTTAARFHAGYKAKGWSAGINYEDIDDGSPDGGQFLNISGAYGIGSGKIAASFGTVDGSMTGLRNAKGSGYTIGYFHNLAKKTQVGGLISSVDYDAGTANDRDVVGFMLVQSF